MDEEGLFTGLIIDDPAAVYLLFISEEHEQCAWSRWPPHPALSFVPVYNLDTDARYEMGSRVVNP